MKFCLSLALRSGADVIVELHPDGEYMTGSIVPALALVRKGADMVLGNRLDSHPMSFGMHPGKVVVTRLLSRMDNVALGTHIPDLHQGFRVYTRNLLTHIPYEKNSDDYIFSFEIITQAIFYGFTVSSVPVSVRYRGRKRGATNWRSFVYTLSTFRCISEYFAARLGMPTQRFVRGFPI
jgi:hypothetical protein